MSKKGLITIVVLSLIIVLSVGLNIWQHDKSRGYKITYDGDSTKVSKITVSGNKVTINHDFKGNAKIKKISTVPESKTEINFSGYNEYMKKVDEVKDKSEELNRYYESNLVEPGIVNAKLSEIFEDIRELDKGRPLYLNVRNYGFTNRFQIGFGFSYSDAMAEWKPLFGWKFLFWNRINLGGYINQDFVGVGLGRHLDNLVPLFKNTELRLVVGPGFKSVSDSKRLNFWLGATLDL